MSYGPTEPTDEDWCGMSAHDFRGYVDPDTGWHICMCGMFTEPVEGEPHDEYTALRTNLVESYIEVIAGALKAGGSDSSYVNINSSRMRIDISKLLADKTPKYLQTLLASIKSTELRDHGMADYVRPYESYFDLAVAVGFHLDSTGRDMLDAVLMSQGWDRVVEGAARRPGRPYLRGVDMLNEQNICLARCTANLLNLIRKESFDYRNASGYKMETAMTAVCPLLESRPDMVRGVAALYNSRGISEASTALALEMIATGEMIHGAVVDGLL